MGDDSVRPRLRLPTLETFSALSGGAFASRGVGLTRSERRDARRIFGDSINLDPIRIVEASIVAAPTTLGNFIRVPPGYQLPRNVLIHELTHVWQYQTKGTAYISDSLLHQASASITSGDRNAAYQYRIVPRQSIHRYTAEQQAMIVEHYFSTPSLHGNADYERMLREVRTARPIGQDLILEEAAFGPGASNPRLWILDTERDGAVRQVPLIRFEFRGL